MRRRRVSAWWLMMLVAGACGGDTSDSNAWAACRDYVRLVHDVSEGIVSPAELRPRLQKIDRNAQIADDPRVRDHARALLRAVTTGEGLPDEDAAALTAACKQHL